jgi:hypothetical protein
MAGIQAAFWFAVLNPFDLLQNGLQLGADGATTGYLNGASGCGVRSPDEGTLQIDREPP